jgi:hypothetical protein
MRLKKAYRLRNRNSLLPSLEKLDELLCEGLKAWRWEFGHYALLVIY